MNQRSSVSDKQPYLDWEWKGMKVRPYDNPLRFIVTSQTEGESKNYIVQLDAYWCTGQCTCEDFQFRHEPILTRRPSNDDESLRCKHIEAARQCFASHMIRLLSQQEANKE